MVINTISVYKTFQFHNTLKELMSDRYVLHDSYLIENTPTPYAELLNIIVM